MAISGWMEKENVVFTYNEYYSVLEGNLAVYDRIDGPGGHSTKWNKPDTEG